MRELFKEFGRAFFIGALIFLVLGLIEYLRGDFNLEGSQLLVAFAYNQLYSVTLYTVNSLFVRYILDRYGNEFYKRQNLLVAFSGSVFVTLAGIFLVRLFINAAIEGESFSDFIEGESADFYYIAFFISLVITTLFYLIYYYKYRQENKVQEQQIIAKAASAQFDALKNQLDPHFLFNSLNVLTSLIEENPEAATRFTTSLSKVYRYVLEQKNKPLVSVAEELRFAREYMSLIEMRFEDSIVFEAPDEVRDSEAKVVPLSLQLLLENAVKHNQVTPSRKLHIRIYEQDGVLVITNNLQPKSVVKEGAGVGLQNIRQRYGLITDRPVGVVKDKGNFTVSIPLLRKHRTGVKKQSSYLEEKRYEMARKKVEELKGFYVHFGIYLVMSVVFVYLNFISSSFPWSIFPIAGWGLGVLGHASEVFDWNPFFNKQWEERQIRKYMNEDRE
jgi:hypothetical protein